MVASGMRSAASIGSWDAASSPSRSSVAGARLFAPPPETCPLRTDTFDLLISTKVLEHIPPDDYESSCSEIV